MAEPNILNPQGHTESYLRNPQGRLKRVLTDEDLPGFGVSTLAALEAAVDALRKSNVERGGQPPEMTKDADKPAVPGPFDDMDEDFIRAWLKDAGEPDPHPSCKLSTLRSKANEANKKIEDAKRAKVAA